MKGKPAGSKASPELYLAFFAGMSTKELREKTGKSPAMISYYFRKYKEQVEPAYKKLLKGQVGTPKDQTPTE